MKGNILIDHAEEMKRCENPVYFYNKYVRKEGEKMMTEKEYNDVIFLAARSGRVRMSFFTNNLIKASV